MLQVRCSACGGLGRPLHPRQTALALMSCTFVRGILCTIGKPDNNQSHSRGFVTSQELRLVIDSER